MNEIYCSNTSIAHVIINFCEENDLNYEYKFNKTDATITFAQNKDKTFVEESLGLSN
jgi:hypothetical protein